MPKCVFSSVIHFAVLAKQWIAIVSFTEMDSRNEMQLQGNAVVLYTVQTIQMTKLCNVMDMGVWLDEK